MKGKDEAQQEAQEGSGGSDRRVRGGARLSSRGVPEAGVDERSEATERRGSGEEASVALPGNFDHMRLVKTKRQKVKWSGSQDFL